LAEHREATRSVLLKLLDTPYASRVQDVLPKLPEVTTAAERSATASILLDRLTTAQDYVVDAYVRAIVQFTPPEEHNQTCVRLLDVLERVQAENGSASIVGTLRDWNYRQSIPRLKKILETADCIKSATITRLLAGWEDKDSAKDIRAVIERSRFSDAIANVASVNTMMADLYALQGADCASYLADVLLSASPNAQYIFLNPSSGAVLRTIRDKPVTDAIRQLAESSPNADVKKLASELVK
jgi:hypothetical protein